MYTFNFIYVKIQTTIRLRSCYDYKNKNLLNASKKDMSRRPVASFGQQCSRQKRVSFRFTVRRVPWHLPFWVCFYKFNFRYLVWLLSRIMNLESMYQKNETIVADNQQPLITNVTKRFPLWAPRYICASGGSRRLMLGLAIGRKGATKRHWGSTGAAAFPPSLLDKRRPVKNDVPL